MAGKRNTCDPVMSRKRQARIRALVLAAPVLAMLVGLAVWNLAPREAEAHAVLVRSDPPVNARLQDAPTMITTFFSESLDTRLSSIHVIDGAGKRVDSGEASFGPDPAQMSIGVSQLQAGFYSVLWETLSSADGHLLKGS